MYKLSLITPLLVFFFVGLFVAASAQQQGPERWEETIQQFEKADKTTPVEQGLALFVGSSSITMWKDIANYFPEHKVLNRGFGGSNFTDLLYYAERIIFPYKPAKVFVYEGDNDVAMGKDNKTTLQEAKKLRKMIAKALGKNIPVIFISPKPSVARWNLKDQYLELNASLKKYADKKKFTEYADVWTPAIGPDGKVFPHIFLQDNLHMNADGYKIWQKVIAPFLQ
ncbi:MAG: GDSL-type esterase/lipase family protein [Saprospiraceae bacterium]